MSQPITTCCDILGVKLLHKLPSKCHNLLLHVAVNT